MILTAKNSCDQRHPFFIPLYETRLVCADASVHLNLVACALQLGQFWPMGNFGHWNGEDV